MTKDFIMSVIPTQALLDERSSHQLHYVNDRRFDYAFRELQFIPTCLEIWSEVGVDLSGDLIDYLWREYADKRPGRESGERNRASKLALDALREVYTMTAIGIAHNAVIRYSAADDMSGRDFKMIMPTGRQHWVQFRVQNSQNDYLQTKEIRRSDRGVSDSKPILLTAHSGDLLKDHQPYIPNAAWIARVPEMFAECQLPQFTAQGAAV